MSSFDSVAEESPNQGRRTILPSWSSGASLEVRAPSWMTPGMEIEPLDLVRDADSDPSGLYSRMLEPANRGRSIPLPVVPTEHRPTSPPVRPNDTPPRVGAIEAPRPATARPSIVRVELEAERAAVEALREAVEQERERVREMVAQFATQAAELAVERARATTALDVRVVELAMVVAEALIGDSVRSRKDVALQFVREALAQIVDTSRALVRAAPDAAAALRATLGESNVELEGVRLDIKSDPSLEGCDCVVETPCQRVDGRLRERLDAIGRALFAEVARDPEEGAP